MAADFFAVDFFAVDFFAVDFFAVDFFAVDFVAVDFDGVDFVAAEDFVAVVFFAADDFEAGPFFAGDFVVVEAFLAGAFFAAGAAFLVAVAEVCLASADLAAALLEAPLPASLPRPAIDFTLAAARPGAAATPAAASCTVPVTLAGSCLAPETTALRSAPGRNFGTAVSWDCTRSPVRGLRTHRASRTRFSKDPKPVMATFSPRATSRVMVSSTDSRAYAACFRLPSKRWAISSISSDLFTGGSSPGQDGRARTRPLPAK